MLIITLGLILIYHQDNIMHVLKDFAKNKKILFLKGEWWKNIVSTLSTVVWVIRLWGNIIWSCDHTALWSVRLDHVSLGNKRCAMKHGKQHHFRILVAIYQLIRKFVIHPVYGYLFMWCDIALCVYEAYMWHNVYVAYMTWCMTMQFLPSY